MKKILAVFLLFLCGCSSVSERELKLASVGEKAPAIKKAEFSGISGSGEIDFSGKVAVLTFFASWDEDAGEIFFLVSSAASHFGPEEVEFYMLTDENIREAARAAEEYGASGLKVVSVPEETLMSYRVYSRPESVIIKNGEVKGFIRTEALNAGLIGEILSGGELANAPFIEKDDVHH